VAPGVVVAAEAVLVMVRAGVKMATVAVQAAFRLPGGQLLPGSAETAVFSSSLSLVDGLSVVTE
jgi:hypothetical protein